MLFRSLFLSASLFLFIGTTETQASEFKVFTNEEFSTMLGSYPEVGSEAHHKDFDALLHYQNTRTEEECALAAREESVTLGNLFGGKNGPLTRSEVWRLTPSMLKAYSNSGVNIYLAKNLFKRPRPYDANPDVKPCIDLEGSYAYPSGHTTLGWVFAHLLSEIYPERREAFMKRASEIGRNRILGGVHHPSDIVAGKKLALALVARLKKNQEFVQELEYLKAKKEL